MEALRFLQKLIGQTIQTNLLEGDCGICRERTVICGLTYLILGVAGQD